MTYLGSYPGSRRAFVEQVARDTGLPEAEVIETLAELEQLGIVSIVDAWDFTLALVPEEAEAK